MIRELIASGDLPSEAPSIERRGKEATPHTDDECPPVHH
jgi:hypothetical protein